MPNSADLYKKEISLVDFAKIEYNYQINRKKSSRRQVVLEKDDIKIIVSRNAQGQYWYFNPLSSQDKGTIIDFVLNREQCALNEALEVLAKFMSNYTEEVDGLATPSYQHSTKFDYSSLEDFYYLEKRGLLVKTIFADEFRERIFNSTYKNGQQGFVNIAFPLFHNRQIVGLELKNAGFHGYAPGSLKAEGIWISDYSHLTKDESAEFVISESGIDCLSYHQLFPVEKTSNRVYISTGGVITEGQLEEIQRIIHLHPQSTITLACDNDLAGVKKNIQLLGQIEVNERSKRLKSRLIPVDKKNSVLTLALKKGKANLDFEVNSLAQIFTKDQLLHIPQTSISTRYHQDLAKIQLPIKNELEILNRIETIIPLIRGVKGLISVHKPQHKDFNEDLTSST